MAFQNSTRGVHAQINMTPMIDVLLVLLILFMVIAPTRANGLSTEIAQNALNAVKEEPSIVLEIAADQSLRVNTHPLEVAQLSLELQRVFRSRANRTLFLKGSGDLPFSAVASAIDTARGAGVDRIALLTKRTQE